jgi:hypothetical protein
MIEIVPISPAHIEGFHRTLDLVARERRYLALLEAPPLESMRAFNSDIKASASSPKASSATPSRSTANIKILS